MTVSRQQRYLGGRTCACCGGTERDPRGRGRRCYGYVTEDDNAFFCTREELAGGAVFNAHARGWLHRRRGDCPCGHPHEPAAYVPAPALTRRNRRAEGRHDARDRGRIVARYDYHDAQGAPLFQVRRWEPKAFTQHAADGHGGWRPTLGDARRVLFHLPQLLAADPARPVFVVEGEKDVLALELAGLVATTNPMGAEKWRDEYAEALRGRHVVILADHDAAGARHAEQVAASVAPHAASVKVIRLPGLPAGGDVSDWFATGHTPAELDQLVAVWPPWLPPAATAPAPVTPPPADHGDCAAREGRLAAALARAEGRARRFAQRARAARREARSLQHRCDYHGRLASLTAATLAHAEESAQVRIIAVRTALELEHQYAEDKVLPGHRYRVAYSEPAPTTAAQRRGAGYSLAARAGCSPKTVSRGVDRLVAMGALDRFVDKAAYRDGDWHRDAYLIRPAASGHPGLELLQAFTAHRRPRVAVCPPPPARPQVACPTHPAAPVLVTHTCSVDGAELHRRTYTPRPPAPTGQNVRLGIRRPPTGQFVPTDGGAGAAGPGDDVPPAFRRAFGSDAAAGGGGGA